MTLPIVHGSYQRRQFLGMVADYCPFCDEVRPCFVSEQNEVEHLNFIPLGHGTRQGTWCKCSTCRAWFACRPDTYDRLIEEAEVTRYSIESLLEWTNSRLARTRSEYRQLEKYVEQGAEGVTESEEDAMHRLAISWLSALDDGSGTVEQYEQQLLDWDQLTPPGRHALLSQVMTYLDQQKQTDRAVAFVQALAPKFPNYWSPWFLILVPAMACALAMPALWLVGRGHPGIAGIILVIMPFVAVLAHWRFQRFAYKHWFRNHVIVAAAKTGIDLQIVFTVLSNSKWSKEIHAREMAEQLGILAQLLAERSQPLTAPNSDDPAGE